MRVGGPFPFNPAGSFPFSLPGGGYVYPPQGNYLITLGNQSILQWWDPINSDWRNLAPAGCPTIPVSVDGYNYRILNNSGTVQGAAITNAGSGGTTNGIGPTQTGVTVAVAAPGGNGQTAKGYAIVGGAVGTAGGSMTVTQAGSGFLVAPLILVDPPPPGGIQCTATAAITSAGVLTSVTIVNPGAGYTAVPNVYVIPQFLDYPGQLALPFTVPTSPTPVAPNAPPGQIAIGPGATGFAGTIPQNFMQGLTAAFPSSSGALVTAPALVGSGTLTGIVITDYGALYNTTVPAISFSGGGLAGGVAATALMSWGVQSATQTAGTGFTVGSAIQSDLGLLTVGGASVRFYNNDLLAPRMMAGVLTNTNGTFTIEDPGYGIPTVLASTQLGVQYNQAAAPTVAATYTIVMGGITDTSIIQAFVNE